MLSFVVAIASGVAVAATLAWVLRVWRRRGRVGDYARWIAAGVAGMLAAQAALLALGAPLLAGRGARAAPGGALGLAVMVGAALGTAFARGARLTGGWRELERGPSRRRDG
jgi:hypothetical protein